MSGGDDEDYGADEVLTGAELYLYLLRQNEEQLQRAQGKLQEYTALKDTLQHLAERSRRRVLAPVAGGLAYYAAELNATNTITVLLGDGWFAERSATQACEIAGRRVDFLRREAEVLQQEQASLRAKQELFLSELPEARGAVAELMAAKEARTAAGVSDSATAGAPAASGGGAPAPASLEVASPRTSASPSASPPRASPAAAAPAPGEPEAPLDLTSIDAALATFDELDELTEDELIALEAELGDRVNDDEYVEQIMTERMIAKKEARIRAELAKRSSAAAPAPTLSRTAVEQSATATPSKFTAAVDVTVASAGVPSGAEEAVSGYGNQPVQVFRTPGDIGGILAGLPSSAVAPLCGAQRAPHETSAATQRCNGPATSVQAPTEDARGVTHSLAEASAAPTAPSPVSPDSPSPHKGERHVHFATEEVGGPQASVNVYATTTESTVQPRAPASSSSLLRSTYTVGDIVEHCEATTAAAAPLPAMPPPLVANTAQKPKRRSLFMRELEGDGA